jgi:hypothetical protein
MPCASEYSLHSDRNLNSRRISRGMYSQFTSQPPFSYIEELFLKATGRKLSVYTVWRIWLPVDSDEYFIFQPYIRPCHQQILIETINGFQPNPCSLLRQLLRPYGLMIQKRRDEYKVCTHSVPTVGKKAGATIIWSGPGAPTETLTPESALPTDM